MNKSVFARTFVLAMITVAMLLARPSSQFGKLTKVENHPGIVIADGGGNTPLGIECEDGSCGG